MVKNDLSSLIKQAQKKKIETPKQEVRPVKESEVKNEKIFSLYMPEEQLTKLKFLAIERKTSIKNLINQAVSQFYDL
ncbi:hypothetical protein ACT4R9_10405 [Ornithobacterium rhinotracheale]|uniref:hypothetical protein n=1 Tax=Ornithobacterium rhinotracheale TaxID=28251 RepID=UPI003FA4CBC8